MFNMSYVESPEISTPFLDKNAETPFSPYCDTFDIPNYTDYSQDLSVENYLNSTWKFEEPTVEFNGNPNELLIDKSKTPQLPPYEIKPQNNNYDILFPPLVSSLDADIKVELMNENDTIGGVNVGPLGESDQVNNTDIEEKKLSKESLKKKKREDTTSKKKIAKKNENKIFSCPYCSHKSKRRYNLGTHMKTHDKNRVKEFGCPQCSKRFDRRHDRDRHRATVHFGERSFKCNACSLNFSRRDGLNRHLAQQHEKDDFD